MLVRLIKCVSCFFLFALAMCSYAQTSYVLGPGDEIRMTVYRQADLTTEAQISADGSVQIPLLGTVKLAGLSSTDAATLIAGQYERGNFLKQAQISIFITTYRSQSVAILGKVNRPGKLILEGPTSLTEALAWAGGIADTGSEHLVLIRTAANNKQEKFEYDLQKLLNREAEKNPVVWLKDGDTLYVPNAGRFYLSGEVHSPGMYRLDRPLNVMQALGVGGGFNARANQKAVKIFRPEVDGSVKEMRTKPEDVVLDGDSLVVEESLF
jgi:polysaccharide biosynthesis/export protein